MFLKIQPAKDVINVVSVFETVRKFENKFLVNLYFKILLYYLISNVTTPAVRNEIKNIIPNSDTV